MGQEVLAYIRHGIGDAGKEVCCCRQEGIFGKFGKAFFVVVNAAFGNTGICQSLWR